MTDPSDATARAEFQAAMDKMAAVLQRTTRDVAALFAQLSNASQRHQPCPIHGPTVDTGGMCRPCMRGGRP